MVGVPEEWQTCSPSHCGTPRHGLRGVGSSSDLSFRPRGTALLKAVLVPVEGGLCEGGALVAMFDLRELPTGLGPFSSSRRPVDVELRGKRRRRQAGLCFLALPLWAWGITAVVEPWQQGLGASLPPPMGHEHRPGSREPEGVAGNNRCPQALSRAPGPRRELGLTTSRAGRLC